MFQRPGKGWGVGGHLSLHLDPAPRVSEHTPAARKGQEQETDTGGCWFLSLGMVRAQQLAREPYDMGPCADFLELQQGHVSRKLVE